MLMNMVKNEKSIYNSCTITMVGPKIEVKECNELLRTRTVKREININKKLMDTLNLLVATYDIYCDKFPNSADIIKFAMDVAHTGILSNCPALIRLDRNLEGVEVVLNFINNVMVEHKGSIKWGDTYFSYQAPKSDDYLKKYPYKFKETYELFTETIYPDTVMSYMYRLEQKSIEELLDNGEVNSDKIDYMASEYYNGDYEVCGFLKNIHNSKYVNNKVAKDDRNRYSSYSERPRLLSNYLYSQLNNMDDKNIRVLTASYAQLRSIPLDMALALSFKYDNSYIAIQYIGEGEMIKTYVFNNGNLITNKVDESLSKEFLVREVVDLIGHKYFITNKVMNKYMKEFKYVMFNNFNEGITLDEFLDMYVGPAREYSIETSFLNEVEKCIGDTNKPRKMFFGKTSKYDTNNSSTPKKLYKDTVSKKSVEVFKSKKKGEKKTVVDPLQELVEPNKIDYIDERILKYREEKLKDFK